jgi:NHLM bacteriocin system ABC transporter ATP-binding protein
MEEELQEGQTTDPRELFLLRIRFKEGRLVEVGGNSPILLNDPETVWVVYSGKVDVFSVRLDQGQVVGARVHLCRMEAGAGLFGTTADGAAGGGAGVGLLAVGVGEVRLVRIRRERLHALMEDPACAEAVIELVDGWVRGLLGAVAHVLPPKECQLVQAGETAEVGEGHAFRAARGVIWVRHLEGASRLAGVDALPSYGAEPLPLASPAWLRAERPSRVSAGPTSGELQGDPAWSALARFHPIVLAAVRVRLAELDGAARERLDRRTERDLSVLRSSAARIAAVLHPRESVARDEGGSALLAACRLVGAAMGVPVVAPPAASASSRRDPVTEIARVSRLRTRQVALAGDWWRRDNGPLLAYRGEEKGPVALLQRTPTEYELVDPAGGVRERVTAEVAAGLQPVAYMFYRGFPARPLGPWDLVRLAISGSRGDVARLFVVGALAGVTAIAAPLAASALFQNVVPSGDRGQLLAICAALVVAAFSSGLFLTTRGILLARIESRADAQVQPALWDRLLGLPLRFFRRYSAGELAGRAMGINAMRQLLTGTTIASGLGALFSLFSLGVLFSLDARLASLAAGLVAAAVLAGLAAAAAQLRCERSLARVQNDLAGQVLQLLTGIAKLRVAGAETHAFSEWGRRFADQKEIAFRSRLIGARLACFNGTWPVVATLCVFAGVEALRGGTWSAGAYMAFTVAFVQLLTASLTLTQSFGMALRCVPLYEMAKPILQELPETRDERADPGELSGAVEVSHVYFRYSPEGPPILNDLSFRIEPGQFVAIVGPSGAGKSSILRLLLGFETPEAGTIYFDGHDLAQVDAEAVRRQTGVVLQGGRLLSGSIFRNITGGLEYSLDDAWEAARMAGLDADIRAMPMEMHTHLSEGASTLSGGQRQRLLIARAVIAKPRVLLFDEATSALDNQTQEIVSRSLEELQATRIVIAHRLSTIRNADVILVIEAGRIVEQGVYEELMRQRGVFYDLASRQLT